MIFLFKLDFVFAYDAKTCPVVSPGTNLSSLQTMPKNIFKTTQIQSAENDMANFCRRNLIMRYLNSQDIPPEQCAALSMAELEKLADDQVEKRFQDGKFMDSWTHSLVSTAKSRAKAFYTYWGAGKFGKPEAPRTIEYMETSVLPKLNQMKNARMVPNVMINAQKLAACTSVSSGNLPKCYKALDYIVENGNPSGPMKLMTPKAWDAIYRTNKYDEGLRVAAVQLQSIIKNNSTTGNTNIFDTLLESFQKSGMSSDDAIEATWNTLAAISNAGPNTYQRASLIDSSEKSSALAYISIAMPMLDYIKQRKGYPLFSYPPGIKTNCDSAKSYHFWMAAYLSRDMVKNKIVDSKTAVATIFLAEKGYQLNRDIANSVLEKNNSSSILARDAYDPTHQVIRMDLAFSAAGAIYGANSATSTPNETIDVDKAIVGLLKASTPLPPVPKAQGNVLGIVQKFKTWNKIFVPDAAMKALSQ